MITSEPVNLTKSYGEQAAFEIAAIGPGTLTFQWFQVDDEKLVPMTEEQVENKKLNIKEVQEQHVGNYRCIVKNPHGTTKSKTASLNLKITIINQPQNINFSVDEEEIAEFSITAKGNEPVSYQWMKDDKIIENKNQFKGADSPKLTIGHPTEIDEGNYHCVVNDSSGEAKSNTAILMIGNILYVHKYISKIKNNF